MLIQAPPMARSGAIPRPGQTAATIAALLLPALLLAGLRVPSLFEPHWYGDEAIFAAIAHDVLAGQTLYAEAWDNKPPMIFVTYAAIQAAFGAGMFPLHLVATGFVLGAQLAIMATAWRLHGTMRAAIAGCVFALLFGLPILEGNLAFTETFMALPTSLAVLVALLGHERPLGDRLPWYAAAGILLGVAANYKQVAIFDAAALGLMVFAIEDRRLRSAGALALGFALPHVLALVAFAMTGAVNEYLFAVIGSVPVYGSLADQPPLTVRALTIVAPLLALLWLGLQRHSGRLGFHHFAPLWLAFSFLGATAGSFHWTHYLLQAVPAAALFAASLHLPPVRASVRWLPPAILATILLAANELFVPTIRDSRHMDPDWYYGTFAERVRGDLDADEYATTFDGRTAVVRDITEAIERDRRGDTLYSWSEFPWIYVIADVSNPARYFTSFYGEEMPGAKREILGDLRSNPPTYVMIADDAYAPFPELEAFVAERYEMVDSGDHWRLYGER